MDDNGAEVAAGGDFCCRQDFLVREFVALAIDIAAYSAVEAVLGADVRYLYQPAQIHLGADGLDFDAIRLIPECFFKIRVFAGDSSRETFTVHFEVQHRISN